MSLLAVLFNFHLLGIVVWLGSAVLIPLVILPIAQDLDIPTQQKLLAGLLKRLAPWYVGAMVVVGVTGGVQTVQMSDLNIPILVSKHIVILLLIGLGVYLGLGPLRRLGHAAETDEERGRTWKRLVLWAWVQAALSVVLLFVVGLLTA